jgi:hypothetical protein
MNARRTVKAARDLRMITRRAHAYLWPMQRDSMGSHFPSSIRAGRIGRALLQRGIVLSADEASSAADVVVDIELNKMDELAQRERIYANPLSPTRDYPALVRQARRLEPDVWRKKGDT